MAGAFKDLKVLGIFHEENRFARDSPLEEAVSSEPVSEAKFPASWDNTGNRAVFGRKWDQNPRSYGFLGRNNR